MRGCTSSYEIYGRMTLDSLQRIGYSNLSRYILGTSSLLHWWLWCSNTYGQFSRCFYSNSWALYPERNIEQQPFNRCWTDMLLNAEEGTFRLVSNMNSWYLHLFSTGKPQLLGRTSGRGNQEYWALLQVQTNCQIPQKVLSYDLSTLAVPQEECHLHLKQTFISRTYWRLPLLH